MINIFSKPSIVNNDSNKVFNKESLNNYGNFLNNIKNIKNTYLDLSIEGDNKGKEVTVDIANLSNKLISKIRELYTPEEISSYRVDVKNKAKSIELLNKAYKKIDSDILDWWKSEKKVLPSSIINRTIDNLYRDEKIILNKEIKQRLFSLISHEFNLELDSNVAQSTLIQQLQDIPEVVKVIDDLRISDNSYLKYEVYCLLAENIYNFLSGNENEVGFLGIKYAIKEVAQRLFKTSENTSVHSSFYPALTLTFCEK
ncbi:hypothetical protein [Proteus terrae]|nr:hypothetical protein [Proteus terrae]MBG2836156.1 hypothetical protein [Proteus terrae subsp. cibarius]MBJ2107985.1 hypothetical protein [Proteus terrae]MBJ2131857.1 hypothetical protein [Proteus terrae]MCT8230083.1 hypothetical protein [Proteus terrae]